MLSELPNGWINIRIRDFTFTQSGGTPSTQRKDFWVDGDIPWINSGALREIAIQTPTTYITKLGLSSSSATLFPSNTVVVALTGATTGKSAILRFPCSTNQSLTGIFPSTALVPEYLLWFLQYARPQIVELAIGSAQPHINKQIVDDFKIRLAPIAEQLRIMAKLEALHSKVDACQSRMERMPIIIKRFRQSVLAAACSGRLTEDWRVENPSVGSALDLLGEIATDRKAKAGRLNSKRQVEPTRLDVTDLPELPDSWAWATLDEIVEEGRPVIYGIIKPGPHDPKGVPYVRVFEMKDGEIVPIKELKRAGRERASKFTRATLKAGDLLISKDGTIGKVAVVPPELEGGNITQHLVRASIHRILCRSFIVASIRSKHSQDWLIGEKKGVALQGVNVEDFRRLPLPIPPLVEQQEIARRVEEFFLLADQIEERYTKAKACVDKLTQSILAKAFRGELVPQDPKDEPASVLLERIRKERETEASCVGASPPTSRKSKKTMRRKVNMKSAPRKRGKGH